MELDRSLGALSEARAQLVRSARFTALGDRHLADRIDIVDIGDTAVDDARRLVNDRVGLILADHRLPGERGVDLLVSINAEGELHHIRTVLITGQAGHQDTIRAINEAGPDWYFSKPWDPGELVSVVVRQLTDDVIDVALDPLQFVQVIDGPRLLEQYARGGRTD